MLVETEGLTWEGVECIGVLGDTVVLGFLLSGDGTGRLLEHTGVEGDILVETGGSTYEVPTWGSRLGDGLSCSVSGKRALFFPLGCGSWGIMLCQLFAKV